MLPHPHSPNLPPLHEIGSDLLRISAFQRFWILARPFIFFVAYYFVALMVHPVAGFPFILAMFISNMCAAHDIVHNSLGLPKRATHFFLHIYGLMDFQSGHSFRICHLNHHAVFPSEKDPEAAAAFMPLWKALLSGPIFVPQLLVWSYKRMHRYPAERAWIILEASLSLALLALPFFLLSLSWAPLFYLIIVILGTWLYPVVTAYFPHHHTGEDALHQARSVHGKIVPWLLLGLSYHPEHHLYPRVPSKHLKVLSQRILPHLEASGADVMQVP